MATRQLEQEACSIARSISVVGDPWTLMVIREAFTGVRRFEQFQASLGISPAVLSDRLRKLVEAGVLSRHPYADPRRTRFEYRLTDKGMELYPILQALRTWGDENMPTDAQLTRYEHRGCTGSAQIELVCSDCGQPLTARDVTPLPAS